MSLVYLMIAMDVYIRRFRSFVGVAFKHACPAHDSAAEKRHRKPGPYPDGSSTMSPAMITGALAFVIALVAAATSVTVPLIQHEDRLWTGAFNVGLSYNLSLLIGTVVDYVAIN